MEQPPKPQAPAESTPNFWEMLAPHVLELRKRLLWALVGVAVGVIIAFNLTTFFLDILTRPIGGLENLLSIEVTENIAVYMRISLLGGFIISLPFVLYQLIGFITPALEPKEKRWLYIAIPFATTLFLAGVFFTYFVMLPTAIPFLVSFLGVKTTPRLSSYINFVTSLVFWVGVAFETPLVIFLLAKLHLITAQALLKQWRVAVVVIAFLAAIITPTGDPINMSILMAPLLVLYFFSILLASLAVDRPPRPAKPRQPRRKFRLFRPRKAKATPVEPPITENPPEPTDQPADDD